MADGWLEACSPANEQRPMQKRWVRLFWVAALALCVAAPACKTPSPKPQAPPPEQQAEFRPAAYVSAIALKEGRYADLFGTESYAVWVGPEVAQFKLTKEADTGQPVSPQLEAEAERITQQYVIIECHIESEFADASVAYDVVGFRGIEPYLLMPDGKRVEPMQKIIGSPVEEEQNGALKRFRRTNLLLFPRRDLWFGGLTFDSKYPSVRLILDAHNSQFAFEWPEAAYANPQAVVSEHDVMREAKVGFTQLFQQVRQAAHVFD